MAPMIVRNLDEHVVSSLKLKAELRAIPWSRSCARSSLAPPS
jgi:plasmid stability protein